MSKKKTITIVGVIALIVSICLISAYFMLAPKTEPEVRFDWFPVFHLNDRDAEVGIRVSDAHSVAKMNCTFYAEFDTIEGGYLHVIEYNKSLSTLPDGYGVLERTLLVYYVPRVYYNITDYTTNATVVFNLVLHNGTQFTLTFKLWLELEWHANMVLVNDFQISIDPLPSI